MNIFVFNVGSTTLKYACVDASTGERLYEGLIDRIGQEGGDAPDHLVAAHTALRRAGLLPRSDGAWPNDAPEISAIAHRVVQGGDQYCGATLVDADVLRNLAQLDTLAPLHNPSARCVVEATVKLNLLLPQVLVFDTAYFSTLEPPAYRYAVPDRIYRDFGVRRYGFHGTSHRFVTERVIEHLQCAPPVRIISLHLGGGASATASIDGRAIDTSMGMTPLEGLVMATRSGDIDPSVPLHLIRIAGMSVDDVDRLLNKESGLLGLCGEPDMRAVLARMDAGDESAKLAIEIYVRRLQKTIGSFFAVLGGLDALIFTAGVGEHSPAIRRLVTEPLRHLGIAVDPDRNLKPEPSRGVADVSRIGSRVRTLVVSTNEELAIAMQTAAMLIERGI